MRKTLMAGAMAALTLAAAGGVALAQQSPDRPYARGMRADADGDQKLSRAEFVEARVQRLSAADADRDGSVTPEEMRAAAQARMAERADTRFKRLDANSDGS
ncbi:MAG: EF-hand domain-containing protein, partial [Brevundimonas sp.]|nr:EF-hand domain-containing protein [Brevundimonas sp.]